MKPKTNLKHRQFFDQCMKDAGYADYKALADDLVLSKTEYLSSSQKLYEAVNRLACGRLLPFYDSVKKYGQPRVLALEIATLLNIDFDDLFVHTLPSSDVVNADALVSGQDVMTSPDMLLTQRDILAVTAKLKPEDLDTFIQVEILGMLTREVVAMRGLPENSHSNQKIEKQLARAKILLERAGFEERKKDEQWDDIISVSAYYQGLPDDFNASQMANEISFESRRVLHLSSCFDEANNFMQGLNRDFRRALKRTEEIMSIPTRAGYALHRSDGYGVTLMLEAFADHKIRPSRSFLNACVSHNGTVMNDPLRHGYLQRYLDAVKEVFKLLESQKSMEVGNEMVFKRNFD